MIPIAATSRVAARRFSTWKQLKMAPPDKILGLTEAFKADSSPLKINLGVGAYRDEKGQPHVLKSVSEAEKIIISRKMDHEYAGIAGVPAFTQKSMEFGFGKDSEVLKSGRVATVQALSGTGACRVLGEFAMKSFGAGSKIYIPNPTWGNHLAIFKNAGLVPEYYSYYDAAHNAINFKALCDDVTKAPSGSLFMLHACAHNPTGCDPTKAQWDELSALMKDKKHVVFFDCAYQGFASGDAENDAYAIRKFVSDGHEIILAQSFAKNFGLYGERIGTLSFVCDNKEIASIVGSQVKPVVRAMYSNPPIHGARIVTEVLSNQELYDMWKIECKEMADRINSMRALLREKLEAGSNPATHKWNHVTDQIGMFAYTGLTAAQVGRLKDEFHIYCTEDGRFSMAGINNANIDHLASSVLKVL